MLDIGFTELLLIAIIALVVLGPERLPGAIRTTAYWVGKIRRSFQNAKDELEKELNVDEIKRQIHNEAIMQELEKAKDVLNDPLSEMTSSEVKRSEKNASEEKALDNSELPDKKKPAA